MRHAGGRVPLRLGARGDARRRVRVTSSRRSTRRSPPRRAPSSCRARACRAYFEERFSAPRMAEDYVAIYEALLRSVRRDQGRGRTRRSGWRRSTREADVGRRPRRRWAGRRCRCRDGVTSPCRRSERRRTTRSSASTSSSTSRPPRRAPTIARASSSTTRRSRCSIASATCSRSGWASRASTTTARASCRGWSCASAAARPLLLSSTVKKENDLLTVDLPTPDLKIRPASSCCRAGRCTCSAPSSCGAAAVTSGCASRTSRPTAVDVELALGFNADYADIFEVRGIEARAPRRAPRAGRRRRRRDRSATRGSTASCGARGSRSIPPPDELTGAAGAASTCGCRRASTSTIYVKSELRRRRRRAPSCDYDRACAALAACRRGAASCRAAACARRARSWTSGSPARSPTWR